MKKNSPLILLTGLLIILGLVFITASSPMEASATLKDQFFFARKQIIWVFLGIVTFFAASKINLAIIKKNSFYFFCFSSLLLLITLIPQFGNQALGARRWLNLGFIGIQPSEILKLASVLFFPLLFSNESKRTITNLLIYLSFPFFLIILEPNLSTAILIVAIVTSTYYLSGGKILPLFAFFSFVTLLGFLLIVSSPYRFSRLKTLINPDNLDSSGYHHNQIILALSSGGVFGKGFANSDQKYRFLPKLSTDSILAVIGEETGFVGLSAIILIYIFIIIYLFRLSETITSNYESLLVASVACWIAYQTLINISAQVALIPLTGIPLPFISYGGSSLISLLFALGLVRNIEKHPRELIYSNDAKSKNRHNSYHRHTPHSSHRAHKTT